MWIVLKSESIIIITVVQLHYFDFDFHSTLSQARSRSPAPSQCEMMLRLTQQTENYVSHFCEFHLDWMAYRWTAGCFEYNIYLQLFGFIEQYPARRPHSDGRDDTRKITCHFMEKKTNKNESRKIACGISRELKHTVSGAWHDVDYRREKVVSNGLINWLNGEVHLLRNQTDIGATWNYQIRKFLYLRGRIEPGHPSAEHTVNYHLLRLRFVLLAVIAVYLGVACLSCSTRFLLSQWSCKSFGFALSLEKTIRF